MTIDLDPPGGGVLIEGTERELAELARTLERAISDNQARCVMLSEDGVAPVVVWLLLEEDEDAP